MFVIRYVRFYASKCSKKENLHKKRILEENMDISFFEKLIMCNNDKIKHEISKPMFDCVNEAEAKLILKRRDPDLSFIDGKVFKTCGSAYVIQKDSTCENNILNTTNDSQDRILYKIEADDDFKYKQDTMPQFESVSKRLRDLNERKLHPFYKLYMSIPKHEQMPIEEYTITSSSRKLSNKIPTQLTFYQDLFNKKNIYINVKRVELPLKPTEREVNEKMSVNDQKNKNRDKAIEK